jgi:hypothetical protein
MAGFSLYEMTKFPRIAVGENLKVRWQLQLKFPDLENVEDPETIFSLERQFTNAPIDVYRVKYEVVEKRVGRAKGVSFTSFVATHHFTAYYHRNQGLLLIKGKKDHALGAVRNLVTRRDDVHGNTKLLDLGSIRDRIERFKGAWFNVPDSADVTSQAFFGPSVDLDERFDRASKEGAITNARLDYGYLDQRFHVGISHDYTLVIYDNNLNEELEIDLVLDIKANLLDYANIKDQLPLKPIF